MTAGEDTNPYTTGNPFMADDSTSGSSAGGGGMNGMDQKGPEAPSEPDYIPLSTKPRQTPAGGGQDPMMDGSAEGPGADTEEGGADESDSSNSASDSDTTGGTA